MSNKNKEDEKTTKASSIKSSDLLAEVFKRIKGLGKAHKEHIGRPLEDFYNGRLREAQYIANLISNYPNRS